MKLSTGFRHFGFFIFFFVLQFYFIFKLYIIVLVLPNIKTNPPQVLKCLVEGYTPNSEEESDLRHRYWLP